MAAATPEAYPLSLHDALPISRLAWAEYRPPCRARDRERGSHGRPPAGPSRGRSARRPRRRRSEEHTSELQSHSDLVCRLLLEKKKSHYKINISHEVHMLTTEA